TDVDDKTIRNSIEQGMSLNNYTKKYKDAFFEDIKKLNIAECMSYPAATDYIDEMVELIKKLQKNGHAYEKDGSVYYDIKSFPDYGKLAHLDREGLQAGGSGRVDSDEYEKDNVSDFVLWKKYNEKDGDVFWETELGKGRPGWHIECSAMSMKLLGSQIDIHTGGIDNKFPHHENEIAQSEGANGASPFVRYWLHCDYLIVNGEKMSKSKGNFYTLRDLLDKGYSQDSIRYLLISTHYRKMLNFTEDGLRASESALHRLNGFIHELMDFEDDSRDSEQSAVKEMDVMLQSFESALDDDLNISEALGSVFSFIKKCREFFPLSKTAAEKIFKAFQRVDLVLGMLKFERETIDNEIEEKIKARNEARKNKDFAESDRIRDELLSAGIILKDTPQGTVWEKKA
ncbi:MAG: cysteine--tRNA ligase, partial [Spirochaetes bacterium]|nr:cysteine--tRNA ligase [Spirochaetota bacterium]